MHGDKWTDEENDIFFKALSMYGTDFSMISVLFPHRDRRHIRNKFKKEERERPDEVERALNSRLPIGMLSELTVTDS